METIPPGEAAARAPRSIQPVVVGSRGDSFHEDLTRAMGGAARSPVHLEGDKWMSPYLLSFRTPGELWGIILHTPETGMSPEDVIRCAQSIDLTLRPSRLAVLAPFLREGETLALLQAGVTTILPISMTAAEVFAELSRPVSEAHDIVSNPYRWLRTLSRAAHELGDSEETPQLRRLLRLFSSELRVDRSSILLLEGDKLRLAAELGMPAGLKVGDLLDIKPDSISAWVIRNRRARHILGQLSVVNDQVRSVRSAVSAPLLHGEQVLGVINFSSTLEGRTLTPSDMAAADVFASMIAAALVHRELSARAVQNERLAAVGATMSSVSHCMKNLLTIFRGTTDILGRAVQKGDMAGAAAANELLGRGVQRLENTVLDILDFSKHREPELVPVNVSRFLAELCESFFTPALSRTHVLELECDVEGGLMLDEYRLSRALMNLLSNSVEATGDGGRIRLSASREGDSVIFSVADSGPGVPEDKVADIFKPFYSTKGSTGTGLGLAMVAKFADENHGRVDASNDEELGGLCVEIILPARSPG